MKIFQPNVWRRKILDQQYHWKKEIDGTSLEERNVTSLEDRNRCHVDNSKY